MKTITYITHFKKKILKIASDGSVINNQGTAAWAIWENEKRIISRQLVVDGAYIDLFRAELTGICGALTFLWLMQKNKIYQSFELYCDSEYALKMIKKNA